MFVIRRVHGSSMLPTLTHGQIVIAMKRRSYLKGDIVIARANGRDVIKRISGVTAAEVYDLIGDNITQTDVYRNIAASKVLGVVVWPLKKS